MPHQAHLQRPCVREQFGATRSSKEVYVMQQGAWKGVHVIKKNQKWTVHAQHGKTVPLSNCPIQEILSECLQLQRHPLCLHYQRFVGPCLILQSKLALLPIKYSDRGICLFLHFPCWPCLNATEYDHAISLNAWAKYLQTLQQVARGMIQQLFQGMLLSSASYDEPLRQRVA